MQRLYGIRIDQQNRAAICAHEPHRLVAQGFKQLIEIQGNIQFAAHPCDGNQPLQLFA